MRSQALHGTNEMSVNERTERIRAINRALASELPQSRRVDLVLAKLALFGYGAAVMKGEG